MLRYNEERVSRWREFRCAIYRCFCSKSSSWKFGYLVYIFGAILGLIAAKVLRMTAFKGPDEPFVVEMPKYRMPNWKLIWFRL